MSRQTIILCLGKPSKKKFKFLADMSLKGGGEGQNPCPLQFLIFFVMFANACSFFPTQPFFLLQYHLFQASLVSKTYTWRKKLPLECKFFFLTAPHITIRYSYCNGLEYLSYKYTHLRTLRCFLKLTLFIKLVGVCIIFLDTYVCPAPFLYCSVKYREIF